MDDKARIQHGRPTRTHPGAKRSLDELADAARGRGHAAGRSTEHLAAHELEAKVKAVRQRRA